MTRIAKVILLSLCFLALPFGMSSAQCQTVEMSLEDLNRLEENCKAQEDALTQSLQELDEARTLLLDLEQDLTTSETALNESQAELARLKAELVKQKTELLKLRLELSGLKTESMKLSDSLQKAEQSLNATERQYQKEKKKAARKERLWQVVAVVLGGVAVAK